MMTVDALSYDLLGRPSSIDMDILQFHSKYERVNNKSKDRLLEFQAGHPLKASHGLATRSIEAVPLVLAPKMPRVT